MLDDFFIRALLAGVLVAAATGPFGCFILWQRMAYFGDTLAHASLLGLGLALTLGTHSLLAIFVVCLLVALALVWLENNSNISSDGLLGILSHGSLAIGLLMISFIPSRNIDVEAILFGDILTTSKSDILVIALCSACVLFGLWRLWPNLLISTIDEELASAEGANVKRTKFLFIALLAAIIAICVKIVGVLLVTALLIIPAASARRFASSPENMAILASLIGMICVFIGLLSSLEFDTPAGPSIVACAFIVFCVSIFSAKWLGKKS